MKIIQNNLIPFNGYAAINLFGVLFVRKGVKITDKLINHEEIHTAQQKELGYVFFYILYVIEWFIRLFCPGNAYRNISFEQEAYNNEKNPEYLHERQKYYWIHYLFKC